MWLKKSKSILLLQVISHNNNIIEIPHLIGNFGSVPYGKTLLGYIFLQKQPDGTNYWCDEEQTSTPEEVKNMTPNEFTPIYLVDQ